MGNNKKGVAMLVVVSLILMLVILGGAVLLLSTSHYRTSWHQIKRARALYAAEAALQHILWQLRSGVYSSFPTTGNLPADFEVNGIKDEDISITISDINQAGNPPGVHRIDITVNY